MGIRTCRSSGWWRCSTRALAVAASAVPGHAGAAEQRAGELCAAGTDVAVRAVATGSAKFDLALALGEQRAADGSPAGIDGADRIRHGFVRSGNRRGAGASGSSGCWRRRSRTPISRSAGSTFLPPRSATPFCASGTARRVRFRPPPGRICLPRRRRERPMRQRWCSRMQR